MEKFLTFAVQFAGPFLLLMIIYLFAILPRRRKVEQHRRMIESLKPNDQVVTTAGIRGRLVGRNKGLFLLEVAPDVRFEIEASKIESVVAQAQSPRPSRPVQGVREDRHPSRPGSGTPPIRDSGPKAAPGVAGNRPPAGPRTCSCGAVLEPGDRFCGECGRRAGS